MIHQSFAVYGLYWAINSSSEQSKKSEHQLLEMLRNYSWDFPGGAVVKDLPSNAGDVGSIPGQELDPTCMLQLRVLMSQLRSLLAATKEPVCCI